MAQCKATGTKLSVAQLPWCSLEHEQVLPEASEPCFRGSCVQDEDSAQAH